MRSDCVFTAYRFLSCCNCCDVGESAGKMCALCGVGCLQQPTPQCTQLASRLSNIATATTGQKKIGSENAVWPPDDGLKDARNMLRDYWLPIKSLTVASSWSQLYLLIKDARSFEYKVWKKVICLKTQNSSRSMCVRFIFKFNAWGGNLRPQI